MFGIAALLIWAIVIAGIVAIALIVIKAMGVTVPAWVNQILWVILLVAVGVFVIKLLVGLV